ncbi:MAG TPA: hypothetical protein PK544_10390 [Spirochaetota bacterium]|nr:hypothetical protein [Spirochaetota bacterium]HPJ38943.1 hypothetical protein [Spirochaetota bacterium]HPQ52597.1 hypothetical protein [Spirochaetota bacterium]
MKCEKAMEQYLKADADEYLPLALRLHLRFCRKCRVETAAMRSALDMLRNEDIYTVPDDCSGNIMAVVRNSGNSYGRRMPLFNWISGEVIIIASIFLVQFSDDRNWLTGYFGSNLEIPLYIVLGILVTVYSAMFAVSRLGEFKKLVVRWQNR